MRAGFGLAVGRDKRAEKALQRVEGALEENLILARPIPDAAPVTTAVFP